MNQAGRGSYRKKESIFTEFVNSCLGRTIIGLAILGILLLVAIITCPSEETMYEETRDNIRQCIEANDSLQIDGIDETLNNISYIFSKADTAVHDAEIMKSFDKYNRLEYNNHTAIGVFGLVIPTANFNDFLLRVGPMRKDYNTPAIKNTYGDEEYFGENPDLGGVFRYDGE